MNLLEKLIHKINILQEMADYREYKKAACISLARIGIKAVQQQIILLEAGDNYVLFRFTGNMKAYSTRWSSDNFANSGKYRTEGWSPAKEELNA